MQTLPPALHPEAVVPEVLLLSVQAEGLEEGEEGMTTSHFDYRRQFREMNNDDLARVAASLAVALDRSVEIIHFARWLFVWQLALWCVWLA